MIIDIQNLINRYIVWLKDKTKLRQVEDWVEITTPYLDRHNDYLQILAKKENSGFVITDDGYIITDLENSGCKLESPKRQDLLKITLNGFGVQKAGNTLSVRASLDNFSQKKHNLIQAMLAINDLFYLAEPVIASIFIEDVTSWLELYSIRYISNVKFTGKSGFDHNFDFAIPASTKQPERLIRAINRPSREMAQSVAFSWIDTKEVRHPDSRAYAFLNDSNNGLSSYILDALRSYDVKPILWSKREAVREELIS